MGKQREEDNKKQKEQREENSKKWEEQRKKEREEKIEDRKKADQSMEDLKRRIKETDKMIGDLGNRFGELAEHMVAPGIIEKFMELGFTFENSYQNNKITDSSGRCLAEIDMILENGDIVIAIEVKAKPDYKDVDNHVKRIEVLRRRADIRKDVRKFRGAIAGAIMNDEVRNYTLKTGFYLIEPTGENIKINIPKNFQPREW